MQQFQKRMHNTLITIAGLAMLAFSAFAFASPGDQPSFGPNIPNPTNGSTECVEPKDVMKKNHMNFLLHQRDQTMHNGIRTKTYSLKECINCHVPENSEARFGDDKHFCSSCHNFAGVSIDCFQCHMDRPMGERPLQPKTKGDNPHGAQLTPTSSQSLISSIIASTSIAGKSKTGESKAEESKIGESSNE